MTSVQSCAEVWLPPDLWSALIGVAQMSYPLEACALLSGFWQGRKLIMTGVHPCRNISPEPECAFEIDPADHCALLRQMRQSGDSIVACAHSHPNQRPLPSQRDKVAAVGSDLVWLIITAKSVTAWVPPPTPADPAVISAPRFRPLLLRREALKDQQRTVMHHETALDQSLKNSQPSQR